MEPDSAQSNDTVLRLLELMSSAKSITHPDGQAILREIRAIVGAQAEPLTPIVQAVRRAGAGGLHLFNLRAELEKTMRVKDRVGRTLKGHFLRVYITACKRHFRLEF